MKRFSLFFLIIFTFSLFSQPYNEVLASRKTDTITLTNYSGVVPQRSNESVTINFTPVTNGYYYYTLNGTKHKIASGTSITLTSHTTPALTAVADNFIFSVTAGKNERNASNVSTFNVTLTHTYDFESVPPVINYTQSPTALTGTDVRVSLTITDDSPLLRVKMAPGVHTDSSYFNNNGTTLSSPHNFLASNNGFYTLYAVDIHNNITLRTIEITNIEKSPPSLSLTDTMNTTPERTAIISVSASDNNGIKEIRWAPGHLSSASSGTLVTNNTFSVTVNNVYTVTAYDTIGNTITQHITIDRLPASPITLYSDRETYVNGQPIQVFYTTPPGGYVSSELVTVQLIRDLNGSTTVVDTQGHLPSANGSISFQTSQLASGTYYLARRQTQSGNSFLLDQSKPFKIVEGIVTDKSYYLVGESVVVNWTGASTSTYFVEVYPYGDRRTYPLEYTTSVNTITLTDLPVGSNYIIDVFYFVNNIRITHTSAPFTVSNQPAPVIPNVFNTFESLDFASVHIQSGTEKSIQATNGGGTLQFIQGATLKKSYQVTMKLSPFISTTGNRFSASNFHIQSASKENASGQKVNADFNFVDNTSTVLLDVSANTDGTISPLAYTKLVTEPGDFRLTLPTDLIVSGSETFTSTITYSVMLIP